MADFSISPGQRGAGTKGRADFNNRRRDGRGRGGHMAHDRGGRGHSAMGRGGMRGGRGSRAQAGRRPVSESQRFGNTKQRWRPDLQQKVFAGSAGEGQGFALWRKQKVQFEYKKILRKQKKANVTKEELYTDNYPEHLKHLYLAEEEKMRKEEEEKRRRKSDLQSSQTPKEETEVSLKQFTDYSEDHPCERLQQHTKYSEDKPCERLQQRTDSNDEQSCERPGKKCKKKTSYRKAKEEYERVQVERAKKREEAEKNRKKREEALKLYKQKKMEAYKILSTKTRKGQPNFNVQMEYLLQKIQSNS